MSAYSEVIDDAVSKLFLHVDKLDSSRLFWEGELGGHHGHFGSAKRCIVAESWSGTVGCYFPGAASNNVSIAGLSNSTTYDFTVTYSDDTTDTGTEDSDGSGNLVLGNTQPEFDGVWVKTIDVYTDGGAPSVNTVALLEFSGLSVGDTSFTESHAALTVTINATGATANDPVCHEVTGQVYWASGVADNAWTVSGLSNSTAYDYTVTYMDDSTATGEETTDGSGNLVLGGAQSNFDDKYVKSIDVYTDGGAPSVDTVAYADFTNTTDFTPGMTSAYTDAYSKDWTPARSASGFVMDIINRNCLQGAGSHYVVVPNRSDLDFADEDAVLAAVFANAEAGGTDALVAKKAGSATGNPGLVLAKSAADAAHAKCSDGATSAEDVYGTLTLYQRYCLGLERDASADEVEVSIDTTGSGSPGTADVASTTNALDLTIMSYSGGGSGASGFLEGACVAKPAGTNLTAGQWSNIQSALERFIPSATDSTATVPAEGEVGAVTSITIQSKDIFGNNLTVGGCTVVVSVTGANTATPTVTDVGDGTYTCSYTPTSGGTDSVAITLDGTAISGSPYTSEVANIGGTCHTAFTFAPNPISILRI